ncbi:MAG: UPF0158 family protein [Actinomycetes bacterium]
MLDLERVDLRSLADALDDSSDYTSWWLDPETGEVNAWPTDYEVEGEDDPEERGLLLVRPLSSRESYEDMADFVDLVPDARQADRLRRAISGRGAFRRFKDELLDMGELRDSWHVFRNSRMTRRAVEWLVEAGLVSEVAAQRYLDAHPLPHQPELTGVFDVEALCRSVVRDLRQVYGSRMKRVVLFGSWARGEASEESDVDLLVVLPGDVDPITERRRVAHPVWLQSLRAGRVVSVLVTSETALERDGSSFLARVAAEGRDVA